MILMTDELAQAWWAERIPEKEVREKNSPPLRSAVIGMLTGSKRRGYGMN
jgi:hypothetical protein